MVEKGGAHGVMLPCHFEDVIGAGYLCRCGGKAKPIRVSDGFVVMLFLRG